MIASTDIARMAREYRELYPCSCGSASCELREGTATVRPALHCLDCGRVQSVTPAYRSPGCDATRVDRGEGWERRGV